MDNTDTVIRSQQMQSQPFARVVTLSATRQRNFALLEALADSGAIVEEVPGVAGLLARMNRDPCPDLVVLGSGMPCGAAVEFQQLVEPARRALVLLLPDRAAGEADAVAPQHFDTLAAHGTLLHVLRSMSAIGREADSPGGWGVPCNAMCAGALDLRLETSRAFWKARRVDLSLAEFRVVRRLVIAKGLDVSHREIYDVIKGEGFVSGSGEGGYRANVRAAIKRIRQKFRDVDPAFAAIRSYHGFGYRWDGTVDAGSAQ